ncbi:MAG: formimidoylglutamate deiminase [Myxococcota bacterium]|nr:formimidoylglutamate deiminase [Myxococcota bacterium]
MKTLVFEHLLSGNTIYSPGTVTVDDAGMVAHVCSTELQGKEEIIKGFAIPGMPNLHSHAFQRAMLGHTESGNPSVKDSFWTWRELMYTLVQKLEPSDIQAIAEFLYMEMLEAGYTSVGEFHYVHHKPGGEKYSPASTLGESILKAGHSAGIGMTLLPVLYLHGGFNQAPSNNQLRFVHKDLKDYLKLFQGLKQITDSMSGTILGVAPHSIRAVDCETLTSLLSSIDSDTPVHMHIAEQLLEVQDSLQILGARPVQWLLDNFEVNERWCLVHATHLTDQEKADLAATQAVAGLCPSTEANLGDGIFDTEFFLMKGGRIGIGSDSHVCVSVPDELRILEYGQRLTKHRRNILCDENTASVGQNLYLKTCLGGAQALKQPVGAIEKGKRADIVLLDHQHSKICSVPVSKALDAWVFGHAAGALRRVMVAGKWIVEDGEHLSRPRIEAQYRNVVSKLFG